MGKYHGIYSHFSYVIDAIKEEEKKVYFDASNLHNRIGVSDEKLKTISQKNMEDRIFHY